MSPQPYSPRGAPKRPRSVKVDDTLWDTVKAKAEQRGETITDVIVRALEAYATDKDEGQSPPG